MWHCSLTSLARSSLITSFNPPPPLFLSSLQGHELRFIPTPTPRWPDSLATYDPKTQLLFTNKLFRWACGTAVLQR